MDSFSTWMQSDGSRFVDLNRLAKTWANISKMPVSRLIQLEFLLRSEGRYGIDADHIKQVMNHSSKAVPTETVFRPARLIMQDYAGMAALVDVASLRDDAVRRGRDPENIQASLPVDLVVDHSMITHVSGETGSAIRNLAQEYEDNAERYAFLKWAGQALDGLNVVPPGEGIIHQLNMEKFSKPLRNQVLDGDLWLIPDSVLGMDSHTTMVNGLGILGWGVGGIEATGVLLGDAVDILIPRVVGIHLKGAPSKGVLATDLALRLTEHLRKIGVVGAQLEFFGVGARALSGEDRATIANMCPEFGATSALFPFDDKTADYFKKHGQNANELGHACTLLRSNGLDAFQSEQAEFDEVSEFNLGQSGVVVAGPFSPAQRLDLHEVSRDFSDHFRDVQRNAEPSSKIVDGDIVLAAITSCTNTANPKAMITAGLLAREAVRRGLSVKPTIKRTMTLGSRSTSTLLCKTGLDKALEALGFFIDGFGCGACVGNAGDLHPETLRKMADGQAIVASVLSGNRNFSGRIHSKIKANYLMSPPMVVAFALLGNVRENITEAPLGRDREQNPVFLHDVWPDDVAVQAAVEMVNTQFAEPEIERLKEPKWLNLKFSTGPVYNWKGDSDYLVEPPFLKLDAPDLAAPVLLDASALLILGDNVTTDHISPVGAIAQGSDAAQYLEARSVSAEQFNSYGARRGNHNVMVRGTFANPHLKHLVHTGTSKPPLSSTDSVHSPYEISLAYRAQGRQMVILAGKNYGAGSARDWAAKGTRLLGVKAVIAQSFERIHRSNLVRCGVLPVEANIAEELCTCAEELTFSILKQCGGLQARQRVSLEISGPCGKSATAALVRLDTENEVKIFRAGGLLKLLANSIATSRLTDKKQEGANEL